MRTIIDSGIGYIRNKPADWTLVPGKAMFNEVKHKNTDGQETNALKFTYGEIVRKVNFDASEEEYVADTIKTYNVVAPDDVVINCLNLNYDFVSQRVAIVREPGVITSAYLVLRPNAHVVPRYLNYLLKACDNMKVFHGMGEGIRQTIKFADVASMLLLCPDKSEQQAIVDFLDSKCVAVDETIQRHKKTIEKLEEYKRSFIISAVAGMHLSKEMKESGIDWMTHIPKDWDVLPLRYIFTERKHKNTGLVEQNLLTLSYGKIKRKDINSNEGLLPASFEGYNIIEKGDIVMRLIDLQNDTHSLRTGYVQERGIITSAYVTLTSTMNVNTEYYRYLLHSYDLRKVLYTMGEGIRQSLNYDDIGRGLLLPIPTMNEQNAIVYSIKFVEKKTDAAIARQEQIIEKLQEYRKSLIYHAVTGKIDCREAV